ncbi:MULTISPECIES: pyridoxal-phosphate dependent enzyme [unclassified Nocardioides]|uniref:1-aminocyclopropane-1-carboxylate deaminase/D-cysteine desulfhydrase n=1 Tax=unclassified Nocardioides TaxID=2615069 RepID=UPI0000571E5C|nr:MULTISPECIES: pyridoxal-phosphate dependent enzyme [unclassified Nocardioides]ABL79420.1 D-cysteine desulfhydrase [Nocardioides sp. JS614]
MNLPDLPRLHLVLAPTPLVHAPRLSEAVGVEVWFKRDDLTGRGLGGNKVRTLEYLLGDAVAKGCDALVTGAGPQSNWAMLAALSARTAGFSPHLVFYGDPPEASGNLLLTQVTCTDIRYTGELDRCSVDSMLGKVADELVAAGRFPYVVPRGGATPLGCLGYLRAAVELVRQLPEVGVDPATLWVPTGSGGTQAGLLAGAHWLGWDVAVVGVATSRTPEEAQVRVGELASATLELLDADDTARAAPHVLGGFLGDGYGEVSPAGTAAAELVARTEGIFLDPVFGAKAMAALLAEVRHGTVRGPVIFLVTGGAPTLFMKGTEL